MAATVQILGLLFWELCNDVAGTVTQGGQADYLLETTPNWLIGTPVLSCSQLGWRFGDLKRQPTPTPEEAIMAHLRWSLDTWTTKARDLLQTSLIARQEQEMALANGHAIQELIHRVSKSNLSGL